jgi:predicted nucleotidyltransferase
MESNNSAIAEAKRYTDEKINLLRNQLPSLIKSESVAIVVVGSFGRKEASDLSDLDFFFIKDRDDYRPDAEIEAFRRLFGELGIRTPSKDGAFNSEIELCSEMSRNIGGFEDKSEKLTRRLLFLLEGDWLYNERLYTKALDQLIAHYVRESITEHQLCRFLLNDLIRYYRTICVDFECKTYEHGKPWGDRNIKLQFSRKLLYFSGILVVAETVQQNWQTKREILKTFLRLTPIERLKRICGPQAEKALEIYDDFLKQMSSSEVRDMLTATTEDRNKQSPEFKTFKNKGHQFTSELSRLLSATYDVSHPIHMAIRF